MKTTTFDITTNVLFTKGNSVESLNFFFELRTNKQCGAGTYQLAAAALNLRISLVAQVASVLVLETFDRRAVVRRSFTGSTSRRCRIFAPNALHKSLQQQNKD